MYSFQSAKPSGCTIEAQMTSIEYARAAAVSAAIIIGRDGTDVPESYIPMLEWNDMPI